MTTLAPILTLPPQPILTLPPQPATALQLVALRFDGVLRPPNRQYDVRVEIPSRTTPLQPYTVAHDRATDQWSCGCLGYTRGRHRARDKELPCCHLKDMVPPLRLALELQTLDALPMEPGVWYSRAGQRLEPGQ